MTRGKTRQCKGWQDKTGQDRKEKLREKRKREGRMIRHWEEDLVGGILILCKRGIQGG